MISDILYKFGLILVVLVMNTAIAYTCAATALYFSGSLMQAIIVAVLVTTYIRFNHLIVASFKMEKEKK